MDNEPITSQEAEQAVLGGLMYNNKAYVRVRDSLRPEHFYNPVHASIYEVLSAHISKGKLADAVVLKAAMSGHEGLVDVGIDYLALLCDNAPASPVSSCPDYASIIVDMAKRRDLVAYAEIANKARDLEQDVSEIIDDGIADLSQLQRQGTGQAKFATTQDATNALFSPDRPAKIKTGFGPLDMKTGFARGSITLVGGRASMGKSAFLIEAAFNAARRGLRVDLFSMEMNRQQIAARAISSHMARTSVMDIPESIAYQRIYEWETLNPDERARCKAAAIELPEINFDDTPRLNVSDIRARCNDKPQPLDLVFVDYLNIMDLSDCKQADRHDQKLGLACSRLRDFAKDTGAAVVLLCQLNRGSLNRENNVPQLHDLRDSGELEQHADTVMFVHREHYYKKRALEAKEAAGEDISREERAEVHMLENYFDVIIAKQRMGMVGKSLLRAHMEYNFITEPRA
tara:strand:+ start:1103 stop:2476 length:1374 start_codon:yes stop_codon:yes gene_type:complete